jgi:isoquinoline 1-oxidoreductase beta subunit
MGKIINVSRREFLRTGATVAGGLLLGFSLPSRSAPVHAGTSPVITFVPNAWLRISSDENVTVIASQAEMGQGVYTGMTMIIADELGADWSRVKVENAPNAPAYRNPRINWQFTGNAESTSSFYLHLRKAGAAAREMLIAAAAKQWSVKPSTCRVDMGVILHPPTGRKVSFGAVVSEAAKLKSPDNPPLKDRKEFRLIGKPLPRLDTPSKTNGSATFGIDVSVPGMVHAAIQQVPEFGATFAPFDRESAERQPGVIAVVPLEGAVAVVAETYWQAHQALDRLGLKVESGPNRSLSSATLMEAYRQGMAGERAVKAAEIGDAKNVIAKAARKIEAIYESPFQAHAAMEPMNCTAHVTADRCEVWAPTQGQELAQIVVASITKLPPEKIRINRTFLGGGFGRRLLADFVAQAVLISKAVGRPVKLIWSREEDIQHDFYRPMVLNRLVAAVNDRGLPVALEQRVVSASQLHHVAPQAVKDGFDPSCLEGAAEIPYALLNLSVDFTLMQIPVPTSVWRSTGYGPNVFALESFIDELAHHAGRDPYEYRRVLLAGNKRALRVLDLVADKSGWKHSPNRNRFRGMAFSHCFGTFIGQVVDISISARKEIKVHRVVAALDCGQVINPDSIRTQMESGVAWSLTAAVKSEITFDDGKVTQSNFHDFEVLRMPEMPRVETHIVESHEAPGGIGEVGAVPLIPALVNAVFAATGRRLRSLPVNRHGFSVV